MGKEFRTRRATALALAALLSVACGVRRDESTERATRPVLVDLTAPSGFLNAFATALAHRYAACAGATAPAWLTLLDGDRTVASRARAVERGRARYDQALAGTCLTELSSTPCARIPATLAADSTCARALTGAVPAGGKCFEFTDCENGVCDFSGSCPGTCKPYLEVGKPCGWSDACKPGAFCEPVSATCQHMLGVGEACSGPTANVCAPELACFGASTSSTGKCASRDQGSCVSDEQCPFGKRCAPQGKNGGACFPWTPNDSPCTPGLSECGMLAYCAATGRCRALPGVGEACGFIDAAFVRCLVGICDATDHSVGKCQPFRSLGEACVRDRECGTAQCVAGTCTARCLDN